MITRILNYLTDNPISGLSIWATGWVGSFLPELGMIANIDPSVEALRATHIFYFQLISLLIGTVVGVLTVITLVQKIIRNNRLK